MDWDGGLINFVTQSADAFDQAINLGVRAEVLAGSGRIAWEFCEQYRKKHGSIPGLRLVEEQCGTPFRALDGTELTFIVEKILRRDLFNTLRDGISEAQKYLEDMKPEDALEKVERLVDSVRRKRSFGIKVKQFTDLGEDVIEMYLRTKRGEIGVPLPWPSMNEMCVLGCSEIYDPKTGVLMRMDDPRSRKTEKTVGWDIGSGLAVRDVSFHGMTGRKECVLMKTRLGRELGGTLEHPVLNPVGWKRLDEVRRGDSVATVARYDMPLEQQRIPDEHVILIAALLTEGCLTASKVSVTNEDEEFLDAVRWASEQMNCKLKHDRRANYYIVQKDGVNSNRKRDERGRFTNYVGHPVWKMIDEYGIERERADKKEIPPVVFRLPKEQLAKFIGVFWSEDGYVNDCGGETQVGISLASDKMVRQIRHLLLRFGIVAARHVVDLSDKGWSEQYRLTVRKEFHEKFFNEFGEYLLGKRRNDAERLIRDRPVDVVVGNVVDIGDLKAVLKEKAVSRGCVFSRVARNVGRNADSFDGLFIRVRDGNGKIVSSSRIQVRVLRELLEESGLDEYKWIVDEDIYWDDVVELEEIGEMDVFDRTVPESSSFIANDFIVHNTMGLWPGTLTFFAARPGTGKTFAVTIILRHAWQEGCRVLMVSPEMSAEEIAERGFAIQLHTCYRDIVSGSLGEFREETFFQGIRELKGIEGFYILDANEKMEPRSVEAAIDVVKPDVVGIDSAYMIRSGPGNRYERMLGTVDWLREMAKTKDIPVIALTQFNKEAANRKRGGTMETFAMTDTITWDAHNLFGLNQDEDMQKDKRMEFMAIKVRRPAFKQNVYTNWDFENMDFSEIGKDGRPVDLGYDDDEVPF